MDAFINSNYYANNDTFNKVDNFLSEINNYTNSLIIEQDIEYYIYLGIEHCKSSRIELQNELDLIYDKIIQINNQIKQIDLSPIDDYNHTINRYKIYSTLYEITNNPLIIKKAKLMYTCKSLFDDLNNDLHIYINTYNSLILLNTHKLNELREKCQLYSLMVNMTITLDNLIIN